MAFFIFPELFFEQGRDLHEPVNHLRTRRDKNKNIFHKSHVLCTKWMKKNNRERKMYMIIMTDGFPVGGWAKVHYFSPPRVKRTRNRNETNIWTYLSAAVSLLIKPFCLRRTQGRKIVKFTAHPFNFKETSSKIFTSLSEANWKEENLRSVPACINLKRRGGRTHLFNLPRP